MGFFPPWLFRRKASPTDGKHKKQAEISRDFSAFFDSEVFRNFVDAFRAFSVCRQIRTDETVEMFIKMWYNKIKKRGELNEEKVYLANET